MHFALERKGPIGNGLPGDLDQFFGVFAALFAFLAASLADLARSRASSSCFIEVSALMQIEANEASKSFFSFYKAETISSSSATCKEAPTSTSNYLRAQRAATKDFKARSSAHCKALAVSVFISLCSQGKAERRPGFEQKLVFSVTALEAEATDNLAPNKLCPRGP